MRRVKVMLEAVGSTMISLIGVVILTWFISMVVSKIFHGFNPFLLMIIQVLVYFVVVVIFIKNRKKLKSKYNEAKTVIVEKI